MQITTLEASKIKYMIDNNQFDLIIDLRNEENYSKGHLPGAINIPINEITDNMAFLEAYKNKSIMLYCGIGSQSKSVCKVLALNGFQQLYSLFRGIKEYKYELQL
ncbi:MAG: rhodanese-like domain-containing protein [Romboutsia sp.]|uniref:rhodanese-like domain-containing protein n=1 Tax=Romboutsia sp. TaxID=1965302 RepID=UPI003F3FE758